MISENWPNIVAIRLVVVVPVGFVEVPTVVRIVLRRRPIVTRVDATRIVFTGDAAPLGLAAEASPTYSPVGGPYYQEYSSLCQAMAGQTLASESGISIPLARATPRLKLKTLFQAVQEQHGVHRRSHGQVETPDGFF